LQNDFVGKEIYSKIKIGMTAGEVEKILYGRGYRLNVDISKEAIVIYDFERIPQDRGKRIKLTFDKEYYSKNEKGIYQYQKAILIKKEIVNVENIPTAF
jgi:DNA topoisomerase VI subunit B